MSGVARGARVDLYDDPDDRRIGRVLVEALAVELGLDDAIEFVVALSWDGEE